MTSLFSRLLTGIGGSPGIQTTPIKSQKPALGLQTMFGRVTELTGLGGRASAETASQSSTLMQQRSFSQGNMATLAGNLQSYYINGSGTADSQSWTFQQGLNGGTATSQWSVNTATDSTAASADLRMWQHTQYQDGVNLTDQIFNSDYNNVFQWTVESGAVSVDPIPPFTPIVLKRAEKLLRGMINTRQRKAWERWGFIDVPSPSQKHVAYRIPKTGLVVMYEHGKAVKRLCIHNNEYLPEADKIVAMKMLIEAEEPELHRIANVHRMTAHQPAKKAIDRVPLILPGYRGVPLREIAVA